MNQPRRRKPSDPSLPPRRKSKSPKGGKRRKETPIKKSLPPLLLAMAACGVFAFLIITGLGIRLLVVESGSAPEDSTAGEINLTESHASDRSDATAEVAETVPTDSVSTPELPDSLLTSAVAAPPMTTRELDALPTAIHATAMVPHPTPLSGVRAWTIEMKSQVASAHALALHPSGRTLAVATHDGTIRFIDPKTGAGQRLISVGGRPDDVHFSGDGKRMYVLAFGPNPLKVFDFESGKLLAESDHNGFCESMATMNDGQDVVVAGNRIEVRDGTTLKVRNAVKAAARFCRVSPNNEYLLHGSREQIDVRRFIDPDDPIIKLTGFGAPSHHVAWSPNNLVATGWSDGYIRVHDLSTGEMLTSISCPADIHNPVHCMAWLSADELLVAGAEKALRVVSVTNKRTIRSIDTGMWVRSVASLSHSEFVASDNRSIRRVISAGHTLLSTPSDGMYDRLAFAPDGVNLFLVFGKRVHVLSLADGTLTSPNLLPPDFLPSHVDPVRDGLLIRDESNHRAVYLGKDTQVLQLPAVSITDVVPGPVGYVFTMSTTDGRLLLWRAGQASLDSVKIHDKAIAHISSHETSSTVVAVVGEKAFVFHPASGSVKEVPNAVASPYDPGTMQNSDDTKMIVLASGQIVDRATLSIIGNIGRKPHRGWWESPDVFAGIDKLKGVYWKWNVTTDSEMYSRELISPTFTINRIQHSSRLPVFVIPRPGHQFRIYDRRNGNPLVTVIALEGDHFAIVATDGRILSASPNFDQHIVYQILTDDGQQTLTPQEFHAQFGAAFH